MHHSATDFGSRVGCITAIGIIAFGALAVTSNPLLIIGGGMLIALAGLIYAALGARADLNTLPPQKQKPPEAPVAQKPREVQLNHSWKRKPR